MSAAELVALVTCDLGAIVRGRSVLRGALEQTLDGGVGWVPANLSLTPLGAIADPNPFGSVGDLRLLPDPGARVRVEAGPGDDGASALEFVLCDAVELDGSPWDCCPRTFLTDVLAALERELGAQVHASFEHEFQLVRDVPAPAPFSLAAQRLAGSFGEQAMAALVEAGVEPQLFMPEYGAHQFEIPVAPARGVAAADRAVALREVVREVVRRLGLRATFAPLADPAGSGNGVHVHLSLTGADGRPLLYDADRPGRLSELGGSFAAGILRHAPALSALTAPSPISGLRLAPHRWSVGAVCLAERNREALLRIPPLVSLAGADPARQLRLEYRAADATANPYLALGAIVRAGLEGVRDGLPAPPLLDRDPALLDGAEAERFGVGALPDSLPAALAALEEDETVRGWLPRRLYEAYVGVKQAEIAAAEGVESTELCRRYAELY